MKLLATGDLHLGRRSSRMGGDGDAPASPTTAVWKALVRWAVAESVDVVALTGDVIDRENRFYEAFGPLERGIHRLAEAGIEVVAVAGNHDFDVLPRLVGQLPADRFHLIGRGGRWQRLLLPHDREPALAVDGWSFPAEHVTEDPLESYDLPAEESRPVLGLLHADVGQGVSRYAPVPLARLQSLPHAAWLLGHVHAPRLITEGPPAVLYPGSPQAMDAREEGVHGPWLLTFTGRRLTTLEQIPLSPLRYQRLPVDLTGTAAKEELDRRVLAAVRQALEEAVVEGQGHLQTLICHLELGGRTALHPELEGLAGALGRLTLPREEAVARVDRVTVSARPAVDLGELARAANPAGGLARLLLALEGEGAPDLPDLSDLEEKARQRLAEVHGAPAFDGVRQDRAPEMETVRGHLLSAGYRLLDSLLAQRES